ncbi:MAG: hypothetical protein FJX65_03540 [Alphaproteobacteria bacterium]|nr:hypothetical protein [Alphaproteobacteria bacterium]
MSDDFADVKLSFGERLGRWLESHMLGFEFLCHECNAQSRHGQVSPDGTGCFGRCGLTNKQRAAEYRRGSDAYTPRIAGKVRDRLGIGITE